MPSAGAARGERRDVVGGYGTAEPRPGIHQLTALLKQVAAAVRRLNLAVDGMRQCHLDYVVRKTRRVFLVCLGIGLAFRPDDNSCFRIGPPDGRVQVENRVSKACQ